MKKLKELLEMRTAALQAVDAAKDADELDKAEFELRKLDKLIAEAKAIESAEAEKGARDAEQRGARQPQDSQNGDTTKSAELIFKQGKSTTERKNHVEEAEKRGQDLKDGKKVIFEARAAVKTPSTALHTGAAAEIVAPFEQVGSLDNLVSSEAIGGGDSYKVPFEKNWADGGITEEGADYTDAEPTFGYAEINRVKITAYAEISEEVQKLPNADYETRVRIAVVGAVRRKIISQILRGTGTNSLVGLFNAPSSIIEEKCKKEISTINADTLDDFIFDYGGDENVEGDAVIILNKLTLKEFAKVRLADGRKAYDIAINGNTGTINTIPFVCTSRVPAFNTADATTPWLVYGKLKGYLVTYFSDFDVQRSTDYKFKQGMTAYKVNVIAGGSPVMWNGFLLISKGEDAPAPADD